MFSGYHIHSMFSILKFVIFYIIIYIYLFVSFKSSIFLIINLHIFNNRFAFLVGLNHQTHDSVLSVFQRINMPSCNIEKTFDGSHTFYKHSTSSMIISLSFSVMISRNIHMGYSQIMIPFSFSHKHTYSFCVFHHGVSMKINILLFLTCFSIKFP